jgi:hypothetical protein
MDDLSGVVDDPLLQLLGLLRRRGVVFLFYLYILALAM